MDEILKKQNVIIAHCLTKNGGAGNEFSTRKDIYQRIQDVFDNQLELSCSTIKDGDNFRKHNFFGPVGLILKNVNITYASHSDSGTGVAEFGKRDYIMEKNNKPIEQNIENAIIKRSTNSYNELCVNKYNILGIFLCLDDPAYLIWNIESEKKFYEKTKHHNTSYFILFNGKIHPAIFNEETERFNGNGTLTPFDIYN